MDAGCEAVVGRGTKCGCRGYSAAGGAIGVGRGGGGREELGEWEDQRGRSEDGHGCNCGWRGPVWATICCERVDNSLTNAADFPFGGLGRSEFIDFIIYKFEN
jgi:hypothetical protein